MRELAVEWFRIRELMSGENLKTPDLPAAVALARRSKHKDAVWLTSLFEHVDVSKLSNKEQQHEFFLAAAKKGDMRAQCFAGLLARDVNWDLVQQSADAGYCFASFMMLYKGNPVLSNVAATNNGLLEGIKAAARNGEREALFLIGLVKNKDGDVRAALRLFFAAAQLEHVAGMVELSRLLPSKDPERGFWLTKAARLGAPAALVENFEVFLETGDKKLIFEIGSLFNGRVFAKTETIWNRNVSKNAIKSAIQAVCFFEGQCRQTRCAVDAWTILSTRMKVPKDVRLIVARLVWDTRRECLFSVELIQEGSSKQCIIF